MIVAGVPSSVFFRSFIRRGTAHHIKVSHCMHLLSLSCRTSDSVLTVPGYTPRQLRSVPMPSVSLQAVAWPVPHPNLTCGSGNSGPTYTQWRESRAFAGVRACMRRACTGRNKKKNSGPYLHYSTTLHLSMLCHAFQSFVSPYHPCWMPVCTLFTP